jgi:sugar phosphate permease
VKYRKLSSLSPEERWRGRIFNLTWLTYFSYYFTRKFYSVVKSSLGATAGQLAIIDTAYTSAYAVGQFVNGVLADRIGPRRLLSIGMLSSASLVLLFGLSDSVVVFGIVYGINGLAQSTGWPGTGRAMASWFSTRDRGVVMGYWGTCYQVGGLYATTMATWCMDFFGTWRAGAFGPALWVALVGIAVMLWLRDRPSDVGFKNPDVDEDVDPEQEKELRRQAWPKVLRNPQTWFFGACYFCIKLMRYSLLFWLPYYLEKGLGYGKAAAGFMSTSFELGGVLGVVACGQLADRVFGKRRVAVASVSLVLLMAALWLYNTIGDQGMLTNYLTMCLIGAFMFGPDSLVSGVVAQDLGGPYAAALACGMINGLGSIGAVFQGFMTSYVSAEYGWGTLFQVFQVLAIAGAVLLLPYFFLRPQYED